MKNKLNFIPDKLSYTNIPPIESAEEIQSARTILMGLDSFILIACRISIDITIPNAHDVNPKIEYDLRFDRINKAENVISIFDLPIKSWSTLLKLLNECIETKSDANDKVVAHSNLEI